MGVGYEQHQHLNCYTGHGGEAIGPDDGLQAGVHSAEEGGRAMSNNLGYANSCFVFFSGQNKCFPRKDCNLAACEQGVQGMESWEFDTFTPGPVGGECLVEHGQGKWIEYTTPGELACLLERCDPGYMIIDMACGPINYSENQHVNCYSGHGGTALGPNDGLQGAHDVEGCKAACNNADGCSCFVFFSEQNKCFLRSECHLQQCEIGVYGEESYLFDTYQAYAAGSQSSLAEAPLRAASLAENATTKLSYVVGYQQHQHLNCYTGHGGSAFLPDDGLQAGVHSAEDCGRAMSNHLGYANSCFVFFSEQNKCFLRKDCNLAACEQGVQGSESWQFDTFTPGPIGGECLVEHGQGKWINYSPPGAVACNPETCDPGYVTTDMACVPDPSSYVVGYEQHQHLNCYTGHGGEAIGPDDGLQAGVHSAEECGRAMSNHLA